ncbi:ADP-ribose pyrophosphatase, mitochondrial isoform X3 [Planococcus citri]|uniref:ADP-ribose pyrophosphatase, mitochondrial isoform X3 n=1 Tax=Planococcus citri TaxID=170843 RepID=UPI0031F92C59
MFFKISSLTKKFNFVAMIHHKCRNNIYPDFKNSISRLAVPDEKVSWDIPWPEYNPPNYTSESIKGQVWADPDLTDSSFQPSWNRLDGKVNRESYVGEYKIIDGRPLNPIGRTGLQGRGILGKWGPNHAADPIVTRWKRNQNGEKQMNSTSGKPMLQFVAIKRRDTGEWALPGGMVDAGESISQTLKREFLEEALNFLEKSDEEKIELKKQIEKKFTDGSEIYKGYVDDHRNTDNAWMETVAVHFHDDDNKSLGVLPLHAGDDAVGVRWMDIDRNLMLYANHCAFFEKVIERVQANW